MSLRAITSFTSSRAMFINKAMTFDTKFTPLLTFGLGSAAAFSMAPSYLWPLLVLGLSGLYVLLTKAQSKRSAFFTGYLFGFGYFLFSLSWIGNALLVEGNPYQWVWPLAVCGLPLVLAVFTGLATLCAYRLSSLTAARGFFAFVAWMMLFEWLRGHVFTGFPWNLYGYAWGEYPTLLQSMAYINVYGLTFLTILWCSVPGFLWVQRKAWVVPLVAVALLGVCLGYGHLRLQEETTYHDDIYVTVVQPNIAQEDKWDRFKIRDNFMRHLALSTPPPAATSPEDMHLIIWPETAVSSWLLQSPRIMGELTQVLQASPSTTLLTGYLAHDTEANLYANALIAIDGEGQVFNQYNKHHLVPFGEYIPFQKYIPLPTVTSFSGFEKGNGIKTYELGDRLRYIPMVCYEILFPDKVKMPAAADVIINVTNDAWYGDSAGPRQHLAQARYRAIETGLPVIRAANTGISAIIDPFGRILERYPLSTVGNLQQKLPKSKKIKSLSAQTKSFLFIAFLLGLVFFAYKERIIPV